MSTVQALNIFVNTPVNNQMLHALVNSTLKVLPRSAYCQDSFQNLPSLFTFITKLVKYTNVFTGTLMATLVYLKKLNQRLPEGSTAQAPTSRHRIFLACLILSSKFHNDASPKNRHWAKYTDGLFTNREVNEMERQLLLLLDWDISISNHELVHAFKDFLAPIKLDLKNVMRLKTFLNHQNKSSRSSPSSPVSDYFADQQNSNYKAIVPQLPPMPTITSAGVPAAKVSRSLSANSGLKSAAQIRKFPSLPQLSSSQRQPLNFNSIQYLRSLNSNSSLASYDSAISLSSSVSSSSVSSTVSSVSTVSSETFSVGSAFTPPADYRRLSPSDCKKQSPSALKKSQRMANLYAV